MLVCLFVDVSACTHTLQTHIKMNCTKIVLETRTLSPAIIWNEILFNDATTLGLNSSLRIFRWFMTVGTKGTFLAPFDFISRFKLRLCRFY